MVVKKKKKKKRSYASTSGSGEQLTLRPQHVEKMPPCRHVCPSSNRIREFLTTIAQAQRLGKTAERAFEEAWEIYTDTSPFPATCGRVCPHPCEDNCNRKELDGAVNINEIERAIGDFALEKQLQFKTLSHQNRPEKIAVVGAGPGGLSCAYQLARRGYSVTVFEAAEKPGGIMLHDIARSRPPGEILEVEIQRILDLGVDLQCNTRIGTDVSMDDLHSRYQAVFVSKGADQDLKPNVECQGVDPRGDAASAAGVATAIGQGRQAAESIDLNLRGEEKTEVNEPPLIRTDRMRLDHYEKKERVCAAALPDEQDAANRLPMSQEQVVEESSRCMSCGFCFDCEKCWLYCQEQAFEKPLEKGVLYSFKPQNCTGCQKCAKECPCGFIDML